MRGANLAVFKIRNIKNLFLLFLLALFSLSSWTAEKDYYEILEVSKTASQEEIKKAYKKQAMKWHPDKHKTETAGKQAHEKMTEINKAYDVLKDPQKRQRYDQFGHKNFTSSPQQQTADFYSSAFKDIFNKTAQSPQRAVSEKSLQLFKQLLFESSKDKKDLALMDSILKRILEEFRISSFTTAGLNKSTADKKLRERILNHLSPYLQESKSIIDSNETNIKKEELFKQNLRAFITEVENKYRVEGITAQERRAVELFYQFSFFNQNLNEFLEKQKRKRELLDKEQTEKITKEEKKELELLQRKELKDLRVFKKILSALGLPGQTHQELLLRNYLDALKQSLFNEKFSEKPLLAHDSKLAQRSFDMEDKEILKALRKVKSNFDSMHYENLKTMSNPFKLRFLKNFPGQFIVFQAAIGASLYRQSLTDPNFYGAERNPELLSETMKHSLTPSGAVSFFIFVAVAQQMGYRLYGLGRWMDGKSLKKLPLNGKIARTIAPGAGLGLGFFVSAVFDELLHDPYLGSCIKSLYKEAPSESVIRSHSADCESFYNNWSRDEKWKHYGVDIFTLIGSGVLSHKFINTALYGLRLTSAGSNLLISLSRTVGLRVLGWLGFFVHMYTFMEFHKVLDAYLGQPLKEQLSAGGAKNHLADLTGYLDQDIYTLPFFNRLLKDDSAGMRDFFKQTLLSIEGRIKSVGARFKGWAETASMYYSQSFGLWNQQTNKLLLPYESSSQLLKDLFVFSQAQYNLNFSDSHIKENSSWDSDQQINQESVEDWNSLNRLIEFDSAQMEQDKEYYRQQICPQIDSASFPVWSEFCLNSSLSFSNIEKSYKDHLFFETVALIYYHSLKAAPQKSHDLKPLDYVGLEADELFSSNPKHSILTLNASRNKDKHFELARALIEIGLNWESSLSGLNSEKISQLKSERCKGFFPDYKTDSESQKMYDYCYKPSAYLTEIERECESWYPDDSAGAGSCVQFFTSDEGLKWSWGLKVLSAGIYLLKDNILAKKDFVYHGDHYQETRSFQDRPVLRLLKAMNIYKKGEQKFIQTKKLFAQYKSRLNNAQEKDHLTKQFELSNPYNLLTNMICGSQPKEEFLFSSKKFFKASSLSLYYADNYQPIDDMCRHLDLILHALYVNRSVLSTQTHRDFMRSIYAGKRAEFAYIKSTGTDTIHSFLFDIPAQLEGREYENLYLALEELLKSYSSTQELELAFKELSQDRLDSISSQISQDLDIITENYYKKLVETESPVRANSSLKDFAEYYSRQNILWDVRSFTGGLKGLEISIFQIHYWLDILKRLLSAGEKNQLNLAYGEFQFNQGEFEKMQVEILSLLQSYNDTFKQEQGPYFIFPNKKRLEELKEAWIAGNIESDISLLDKLTQESSYSTKPIMLSSDVILSHILAHSTKENYHKLYQIQKGQILNADMAQALADNGANAGGTVTQAAVFKTQWKSLIDSVLIELNNSLNLFFMQLSPLQLKEAFEDQVYSGSEPAYRKP